MSLPRKTQNTTMNRETAIMRSPADSRLDRGKSEKTVDTAIMSRGGSRSSMYSRNSSRMSLGSSRSLSSKSMPAQSSERSLGGRNNNHRPTNSCEGNMQMQQNRPAATPERRVRKLGYSDEEKQLIESQPDSTAKSESLRKQSRLRKMLSWVSRPSSADSSSSDARDQPRARASSSDNGLSLDSVVTTPPSRHNRSRSAVFVKTPNGLSEGILYR